MEGRVLVSFMIVQNNPDHYDGDDKNDSSYTHQLDPIVSKPGRRNRKPM